MRTSPLPEKNVFAAFEPDVSCETTCLKSFVTNCTAWWSLIPDFRAAPSAARTFHFAEPEMKGFGVTTWTPDLTRSLQPWMCFGLPGRTTKATTESAAMPLYGALFQFFPTRPASAIVSMSRPVERKAMLAGCPAAIARACEPDGPYDCENETPLPAEVYPKREMSFCMTGLSCTDNGAVNWDE